MSRLFLIPVLLVGLTVSSGLAQKVTEDWDHDVNFADYQTYMWHEGTPTADPLKLSTVTVAPASSDRLPFNPCLIRVRSLHGRMQS